ncbi:hypothetical protein TERTU_4243 [Teredinibacter turnerae T7901]|uniref:Uncharacterized protein n=1 Tax=Teredinibacter turnerae (strain ATCC 39867 / T7901) TaxID=377629 RepID=C5BI68_TERTT|nr:hypothetical protein TERTU_4243 [Teredinibacter turnerae T7901]
MFLVLGANYFSSVLRLWNYCNAIRLEDSLLFDVFDNFKTMC